MVLALAEKLEFNVDGYLKIAGPNNSLSNIIDIQLSQQRPLSGYSDPAGKTFSLKRMKKDRGIEHLRMEYLFHTSLLFHRPCSSKTSIIQIDSDGDFRPQSFRKSLSGGGTCEGSRSGAEVSPGCSRLPGLGTSS